MSVIADKCPDSFPLSDAIAYNQRNKTIKQQQNNIRNDNNNTNSKTQYKQQTQTNQKNYVST